MATGSSGAIPKNSGSAPAVTVAAMSAAELASRICPRAGTWSGETSSVPSAMMPTRGAACTVTSDAPADASSPQPAGVTTSPARSTASPAWASRPATRMFSPTLAGAENLMREPSLPSPSSTCTTSYFTTASAPSGTGAPVMMRTAWPGSTLSEKTWPAASWPTTSSSTGAPSEAPVRSAATTAYPSMALLANGDRSISVTTSSASGRPAAFQTGTRTLGICPT